MVVLMNYKGLYLPIMTYNHIAITVCRIFCPYYAAICPVNRISSLIAISTVYPSGKVFH